jgi:hypothetical protein
MRLLAYRSTWCRAGRHQFVEDPRIYLCGVGDELGGCDFQRGQRTGEEASGRLLVAAFRDEYVDDLPVLVDGPVYVAPDADAPMTLLCRVKWFEGCFGDLVALMEEAE